MKQSIFPLLLSLLLLVGGVVFFLKNQPRRQLDQPTKPKTQRPKPKTQNQKSKVGKPKIKKNNLPGQKKIKKTPHPQKHPKRKQTLFVDGKKKQIRITGYVARQKGVIEVFAATSRGKLHEAIFLIHCDPKALQVLFLGFGLKPNRKLKYFGEGGKLKGNRVFIYLRWKDPKTKTTVIYRGEDLVYNVRSRKTMARKGWIFTGSRFYKYRYTNGKGKKVQREIFGASSAGNLVATYHDPDAILNNPQDTGGDDTLYYSNYIALPPRGHPIEMILTLKENPLWDKISKPYDYNKLIKKKKKPAKKSPPKKTTPVTSAPKKGGKKPAKSKGGQKQKP